MNHRVSNRRTLEKSQFGHNASINQGDIHNTVTCVHGPHCSDPAAHATIRVIPYPRNEEIVPRPDLTTRLDALLPKFQTYCSAALWGFGGSGKTQIALDYVYRRCDDPDCSVFWVHADSEATFTQDYEAFARKLGLSPDLKDKRLLQAVRDAIETKPHWVVVIDNADHLALFGIGQPSETHQNLSNYIPTGSVGKGTVLWTSRDARLVGSLVGPRRGIQVTRMAPDEARNLLTIAQDSPTLDQGSVADTLLEELAYLPLAISQAGSYMRRTKTPIPQYLSMLVHGKQGWDVLNQTERDRHRRPEAPNSVLEAWRITTRRIQEESETAYRILHVVAYLDGRAIPHEMLVAASGRSTTNQPAQDDIEIIESITRLREFSFIEMHHTQEGNRNYEIHKLVQEAIRYSIHKKPPIDQEERTCSTDASTSTPLPARGFEAYFSGFAVQVVDKLFPEPEWKTSHQCERYVTHAILMASWLKLCGPQTAWLSVFHKMARFLEMRGRWMELGTISLDVLYTLSLALGENHPEVLTVKRNIGMTLNWEGKTDDAQNILSEVFARQQELFGGEHWETLHTMLHLADVYRHSGQYDKSVEMSADLIKRQQITFGKTNPSTLASMSMLGSSYNDLERYDTAEKVLTGALQLQREIQGWNHQDTLLTSVRLGNAYYHQGRLADAELLFTEVSKVQKKILGDKHPDTLHTMWHLARTHGHQGRLEEAENLLIEGLRVETETFGERHPSTLSTLHQLAWVWKNQGRYEDALFLVRKCFQRRNEVLGPTHPWTHGSRKLLAELENHDVSEQVSSGST